MESQGLKKINLHKFVFCRNYSEFLEYKSKFPENSCEYIVDSNTLRGRDLGEIIRFGSYEERWDYIAIEEEIERAEERWEKQLQEKRFEDKDLEYGFGE